MSDEMNDASADSPHSEKDLVRPPSPVTATHIAPAVDQWTARRAELKKQKRRAHRRKINAANTGG